MHGGPYILYRHIINTFLSPHAYSMQALQNLGISVFIILADRIVGKLGYFYLEIILQIVLSLAFIVGMYTIATITQSSLHVVHVHAHIIIL